MLYVLAFTFFLASGYYGYKLSKLSISVRVTMITREVPVSFFRGVVILALSQVLKLVEIYSGPSSIIYLDTISPALLLVSAIIFAIGFEKLLSAYNSERMRASVFNSLEELGRVDTENEKSRDWNGSFR